MDSNKDISLVDIATLDEGGRLAAAYLVMESLPPYYKMKGVDEAEMAVAVAAMLGEPGSEIEKGFAAVDGNKVAGILTYINTESLPGARMIGAQKLLRSLSPESAKQFRETLKHYNADYGTAPERSLYLSRFAIQKSYRGGGLAGQMMDRFLSSNEGVNEKQVYSLHVDRDNNRAIAFYRKYGFASVSDGKRYLTMVRD